MKTVYEQVQCPYCSKVIASNTLKRHYECYHLGVPRFTEKGLKSIREGKKNTEACARYQATRSTLVSLDNGQFRPFSMVKISDMNRAKCIRLYGAPLSDYKIARINKNHCKLRWVNDEEFDGQYYYPNKDNDSY